MPFESFECMKVRQGAKHTLYSFVLSIGEKQHTSRWLEETMADVLQFVDAALHRPEDSIDAKTTDIQPSLAIS